MKRIGYIYEKLVSLDNINAAIMRAAKGKTKRKMVSKVLENPTLYALKIQKMLKDKTYVPSPYVKKVIQDGVRKKERVIYKPQFYPDQCIHWAIMLQLESILMRGMYHWNCASIKNRGIYYGFNHIKRVMSTDIKNTKYCLKLDVKKFYPSIDKEILKEKFRRIIKDNDFLWLIDTIIDSSESGVPIGNYTSQWFANFYLTELDEYIKSNLKIKHYVRYMDDMVMFSRNKKELHNARILIDNYLQTRLHLRLKENYQVFKTESRPLDFLGYRFNRVKKELFITLRRSNFLRFTRRIRKISKKKIINMHDACAVISMHGWIGKANSYKCIKDYISKLISIVECKKVVASKMKGLVN